MSHSVALIAITVWIAVALAFLPKQKVLSSHLIYCDENQYHIKWFVFLYIFTTRFPSATVLCRVTFEQKLLVLLYLIYSKL